MASSSAVTGEARSFEPAVDDPAPAAPLGFRRLRPSAAGWVGLLAPGLAAGLLAGWGRGHGRAHPGRVAAAAVGGALLGVAVARAVDELRWRRSAVCLELTEPDAVLDLLQEVRSQGVQADMIRAEHAAGRSGGGYALRYRARDDRRV
ncbi:hypothetical protein, partial [Nakamurella sp.]|uniref:hypothetical protein n=1 Tax=Nakamurella sp. TaxID=1869182 RepID=UPI003B3AF888